MASSGRSSIGAITDTVKVLLNPWPAAARDAYEQGKALRKWFRVMAQTYAPANVRWNTLAEITNSLVVEQIASKLAKRVFGIVEMQVAKTTKERNLVNVDRLCGVGTMLLLRNCLRSLASEHPTCSWAVAPAMQEEAEESGSIQYSSFISVWGGVWQVLTKYNSVGPP